MKNIKAIERDKWLESKEGQECRKGFTGGDFLRNRLEIAWIAGWDAASTNNHIILGALDTLGTILAEHGHAWTEGERTIYEQAVAVVKHEPLGQQS